MFYGKYEKFSYFLYRLQLLKLKILGAKIGKNIKVFGKFFVSGNPKNLTIEDNVTINHGVYLNCRNKLTIKENCRLSAYAKIYTASLETDSLKRKHTSLPVTLEKNVWIATNSTVLQGVTIGENSVLAAHSLLTESAKPNSLYYGTPAKFQRTLNI